MNFIDFEKKIQELIAKEKGVTLDEIEILGGVKLSAVLTFNNKLMGSVEYVLEKSIDLMLFEIQSNSLEYTKTIELTKNKDTMDVILTDFLRTAYLLYR